MENKIINLSYLKMNFSQLLNGNRALTITSLGCDPVEFEEWIEKMEMACGDIYCDLKELGLEMITITYENGLQLTFRL